MSISIVIGTYGDEAWRTLAEERAWPSAIRQEQISARAEGKWKTPEVVHVHGETLAQARNQGAAKTTGRWLLFLDADDELMPGYVAAMHRAIAQNGNRDALYTPIVEGVYGLRPRPARFFNPVPIENGNWLVIGTVISRDSFMAVGGFEEFPFYEDWALFARIQKRGPKPVKVPGAVYRAHRSMRGRNNPAGGRRSKLACHAQVRRAVFPELYEEEA